MSWPDLGNESEDDMATTRDEKARELARLVLALEVNSVDRYSEDRAQWHVEPCYVRETDWDRMKDLAEALLVEPAPAS